MNRRRFVKIAAIQSLAFCGGKSLLASGAPSKRNWSGILFGTDASIQIVHANPVKADRLLNRCISELLRLESIFTLYDSHSQLSRLNREGFLKNPEPELRELIETAIAFGHQTDGVFDITVHSLVEALRANAAPSELAQARQSIDYRQIEVSPNCINLTKAGSQITLNGIAQGYITDTITDLLNSEGVEHTLVELGEKRALGQNASQQPWQIGLANPSNPFSIDRIVELSDKAMSSSAGYGTPFSNDRTVHHLVDPTSGTSSNTFHAVHVLAPTATEADALSTTLACCAKTQAETLLNRFPETEAIFYS